MRSENSSLLTLYLPKKERDWCIPRLRMDPTTSKLRCVTAYHWSVILTVYTQCMTNRVHQVLQYIVVQECHVDEAGCYTDDVGKRFAGLNVLTEANDKGF